MVLASGNTRAPMPVYLAASFIIFVLTLSAADSIGFVPDTLDGTPIVTGVSDPSIALSDLPELGVSTSTPGVLPEKIEIPSINLDLMVQNPLTRDVAALDALLQNGPARYVDSAKLGENGNVLIFAHSSHLPIVHNQMFRAFNRISELKAGDSITVIGDGKSFLYSVTSIRKADVNDAVIDLSPSLGKKLTLVTCDTLTGKSARFILEADFVAQI